MEGWKEGSVSARAAEESGLSGELEKERESSSPAFLQLGKKTTDAKGPSSNSVSFFSLFSISLSPSLTLSFFLFFSLVSPLTPFGLKQQFSACFKRAVAALCSIKISQMPDADL